MIADEKASTGPLANQKDVGLWMTAYEKVISHSRANMEPVKGAVSSNSPKDILKFW